MRKSIHIGLIIFLAVMLSTVVCFAQAEETGMPETTVAETPAEFAGEAGEEPAGDSLYACKRLMVFAEEGELLESYGAVESVYYAPGQYYLLEYETRQDTRLARQALMKDLGEDRVFVDEPLRAESVPAQNTTNLTPSDSVSYGTDVMYLDSIRANYNGWAQQYPNPVTVAVLDSGINRTHEMFTYESSGEAKSRIDYREKAYFIGNSLQDESGHGTHVAGIIADGTSNQVRILPVRVLGRSGVGSTTALYNGLLYAREQKVDIINMSLGYEDVNQGTINLLDPLLEALRDEGVFIVAASGNSASEAEYPATSVYVDSVSALKYDGSKLVFDAGYSNYGEVNFAAPGTDVTSAWIGADDAYATHSGTSMATPHITAAAAMVKVMHPDYTPWETELMLWYHSRDPYYENEGLPYYEDGVGMPRFPNGDIYNSPTIRRLKLSLRKDTFTYTGNPIYPEVSETGLDPYGDFGPVTYDLDREYVARSYSGFEDVGTGYVGVEGIMPYLIGTQYLPFRILPKGTSLKKVTRGKKQLTLTWKQQGMKMSRSRITGYQIQLATNKGFTKNQKLVTVSGWKKVSKTVRGLKAKKKYFVRVRTYMTVDGEKYCSSWSAGKSAKTS